MSEMNYFYWVEFYSEFANKLMLYKNNRSELIKKMKSVFNDTALEFPRLEEDGSTIDIDPFTVFGMFNRGIKDDNRIAIITGIAKEFGVDKAVPTVFDGIPVLNNLKSCFFTWQNERTPNDIDNLWDMFEVAIRYADDASEENRTRFIDLYDTVIKQKCVKWNLSMGLYWVRANAYINLDESNRQFVCDEYNMPNSFLNIFPNLKKKAMPNGTQYLAMCEEGKKALVGGEYEYKNFPELSCYAWKANDSKQNSETDAINNKGKHENTDDGLAENDEEKQAECPIYTKKDFLNDVFLDEDKYNTLVNILQIKKNIILQGAPGVGKTYAARRLAYSMMGIKDKERVMMVQFHQSYSYEDFIMGFRPSETGFELKKGPFYEFCKKAKEDNENDYFFIIDEINRGNLSKIFGELFMLIENDKRGVKLQLLYSNEEFSVPSNIYIIGMMNTADRSLAMMDYALRRRFAFFEFEPAFGSDGFKKYQAEIKNPKFSNLISQVQKINTEIENDESLGKGFRIGHSYFCTDTEVNDMWLNGVVDFELIPLLNEYWFDEPDKVKDWAKILKGAIE